MYKPCLSDQKMIHNQIFLNDVLIVSNSSNLKNDLVLMNRCLSSDIGDFFLEL